MSTPTPDPFYDKTAVELRELKEDNAFLAQQLHEAKKEINRLRNRIRRLEAEANGPS